MAVVLESLVSSGLLTLDVLLRRLDRRRRLFELRRRYALRLQGRAQLPEETSPSPLPELTPEGLTAERFIAASAGYRRPVVVRGLLRDAASTRRWSLDYFTETCGEDAYPVVAGSGAQNEDGAAPRADTAIFAQYPQLIRDLELHRLLVLFRDQPTDECFEAVNMFVRRGRGPAIGGGLHCAFAGNFFNNIVGRKEWWLVDPRFTRYLLPVPARPFFYADAHFDPANEERGRFSRRLPTLHAVLEPGDVLFTPSWWWHRVRNLDELTIGCAVRSSNVRADCANNLTFTLLSAEYKLALFKLLFRLRRRLRGGDEIFRDALLAHLHEDLAEARRTKAPARAGVG